MQCCERHLHHLAATEIDGLHPSLDAQWQLDGTEAFELDPGLNATRDQLNTRLVALVELEEHTAYHLAVAAELVHRSGSFRVDTATTLAAWLATTTHQSKSDTHRSLRRGKIIANFRILAEAWRDHYLSGAHIDRFAKLLSLNPDLAHLLDRDEEMLSSAAGGLTPEEFGSLCDRWRDLADPDGAYERWAAMRERRRLMMARDLHGNLLVEAQHDPIEGEAFFAAIEAKATELFHLDWAAAEAELGRTPLASELARTNTQRRADAHVLLVTGGAGVDPGVSNTSIDLVVDVETLADGIDRMFPEADAIAVGPDQRDTSLVLDPMRRCETAGGTPIPVEAVIKEILNAHIRRVVLDGPSVILDAGQRRRLFTGPQRQVVKLRDRRCQHPYCDRPHWECDVDHIVDFAKGGATDLDQAQLLCTQHHRQKTRGHITVRARGDGHQNWYRPDGKFIGTS